MTSDDTAGTEPVDAVEVIAGFDGTSGSEIVVLRRTAGGPWIVAGTEKVVDEATVDRITGRSMEPSELELKVAAGAKLLREQIVDWLDKHTGAEAKPLNLTADQVNTLGQIFAKAIADGHITYAYARRIHGTR